MTIKNHECQLLNYHENHKIYHNHIVQNPTGLIANTNLIILVHSSLDHFDHRQTIRKFLHTNELNDWSIVFILGQPSVKNQTLENKLKYESNVNGDILRMSFIDSYRNLTLKHLAGLLWVIKHCQHIDRTIWILKMDDDIFVDKVLLKKYLKHLSSMERNENQIYCYRLDNNSPLRDQKSKWYVSNGEYFPNQYPSYCSGWAYITTIDTIKKLLCPLMNNYDDDNHLFWIDDVFVTGILRQQNPDINLVAINHLYNLDIQTLKRWIRYQGQTKWFYLFTPINNDLHLMQEAYRQKQQKF